MNMNATVDIMNAIVKAPIIPNPTAIKSGRLNRFIMSNIIVEYLNIVFADWYGVFWGIFVIFFISGTCRSPVVDRDPPRSRSTSI